MPGLPRLSTFDHITITELHPTFGAEIGGVDFSHPVEETVFQEILAAMNKVGNIFTKPQHRQHQMLMDSSAWTQ